MFKLISTLLLSMLVATNVSGMDVLVNRETEITVITLEELYETFTFRNSRWINGVPVTLVLMPLHSTMHRQFLDKYIGIGHLGYKRRYNNRINSSRDKPPIIVTDMATMLEVLSRTVGGVGYAEDNMDGLLSEYNVIILEIL